MDKIVIRHRVATHVQVKMQILQFLSLLSMPSAGKGGLISENYSLWLKSQNTLDHFPLRWIVLRRVTWHLFWEI